jgi:MFS family permease
VGRRLGSARSLALDISPLRESPAYRALWLGQLVSLIGTNMRYVAVPWHVFQLTGSTVAVGLIGLAEVVPLIVFSIIGGAVADRVDRRALIARMQIGLMASSLALAAVALAERPPLILIYGLTAAASAFTAFDRPARSAMIPSLVAPGKLPSAMALRQVLFQVTQITGPAIGGALIAAFSVAWVYCLDAVTFVAALVALRWVPSLPPAGITEASGIESIREGLRFSFRTPVILSCLVIDLVAMIFGMPRAVFPALADRTFDLGAAGVGLLYSAPAAGALLGALTTGWVGRVRRQGVAVLIAVTAWGAFITGAGLSLFSLPLTLLFLALAGASDVVSAVFRGTIVQEATPDALRGRVSAVNIMVVTGGPRVGDIEAGLVAGAFGAPASIVIGGAACLAGTAVVAAAFPSLRTQQSDLTAAPREREHP